MEEMRKSRSKRKDVGSMEVNYNKKEDKAKEKEVRRKIEESRR
jgi:hypothetical protein